MADVQGRDALIYFNIDGTYKEYGCAESLSISFDAGLIETSTVGTGKDATYDYQNSTYSLTLSGLVNNESNFITVWDLLFQQRGFLSVAYRIIFTDTLDNVRSVSGYVLIPNITMQADQNDFVTGSIQFQGTGEAEIVNEVAVPEITIIVTGAGTGQIQQLILRNPADPSQEWTFVGSISNGSTETWLLTGVGGQPGPGEYYIEAVVESAEDENHFSTDAPPTANVAVGSGVTNLNSAPFGNTVAFDFTQSRTITFTLEGTNTPPIAEAGPDQTIESPTSSTMLNGGGSTDPDGSIVSYLWQKISGPPATIITSTSVSTVVSVGEGTTVFRLTVTDNDGATDTDEVSVTRNPEPPKITIQVTGTGTGQIDFLFLIIPGGDFYGHGPVNIGSTVEWALDGAGGNPVPGSYRIVAFVTSDQATNTFSTDAAPTGSVPVAGPVTSVGVGAPFGDPGTAFGFVGGETITFNLGS